MGNGPGLPAKQALLTIGVLFAAVTPSSVLAQQASAKASATDPTAQIVVTAQRRAENVKDVPISIVALGGETLRQRGVTNLDTLQSQVPSLTFIDTGSVKFVNIRGVGLSEAAPQQTIGVAAHLDGTYIAREYTFGDAFFDLSSVEVLRGPQGTYQGQNADGGAIYINTVAPRTDRVAGFVEGTVANYNHETLGGAINLPLSHTVAIRLSAQGERRDSYNKNLDASGNLTANQPGKRKRWLGRAQILFAPSQDFSVRLINQYSDQKSDGVPFKSFALVGVEPSRVTHRDVPSTLNTRYNRSTGILDWNLGEAVRLHANLTHQTTKQFEQRDDDSTNPLVSPAIAQQASRVTVSDHYWTGELDLLSRGNGALQWTAGAAFLDYTSPGTTHIVNYNFPPNPSLTPDWNGGAFISQTNVRRNKAVFAEVRYAASPQFEVRVGARYNHDESGATEGFFSPLGPNGPHIQDLSTPIVKFNALTGRVVATWKPTEDTSIYATISRGYKPGSVKAVFFGYGGPYKSEFVTNYEVGAKGSIAGRLLNYSVSAFYMDYKGYQATVLVDPSNPLSTIVSNVDGSKIKGIEAQLDGTSGGFHWDASGSVLNSSFGSLAAFIPAGAEGAGLPLTDTPINIGGYDLNYAPRFSASAGIAYDLHVGTHLLTPRLRVAHQSAQWAAYLHLPYFRIPAHTSVDARLTYQASDNLQIEGFVTNLLDHTYIANVGLLSDGIGHFLLAPPREFGVTARLKF